MHGGNARRFVGDVGLHRKRAPAQGAHRAHRFIGFLPRSVVDERDVDTGLRKRGGHDRANALAARNQGYPAHGVHVRAEYQTRCS